MRTFLVAFALSLLCSLLLTRVVRDAAIKLGLTDRGGGRKIHTQPIPRLGGVAVALSLAAPLFGMFLWSNRISRAFVADQPLLVSLLGGGAIMLAVGIWDDLRDTRALVKLGAQIAASLVVVWSGIRIEGLSVPFADPIALGAFSIPATVFWMLLVMNAVNLIDGMDGLAGGIVVLAGGTLFVMSVIEDNGLSAMLLASMVGATAGFLAYNRHPATIFLGDTGSLFLGFMLALVSVHSSQKSYAAFSIGAAVLALGLPIFDLGMAVVRRTLSGAPVFSADQHHVHHILLRKGLTQSQSVLVLYGGAGVLAALAFVFIYADDAISAVAIGAVVPLVFVSVRFLGYTDIIRAARRSRVLESVEQEAGRRVAVVEGVRARMEHADSLDALWALVGEAAHALGAERVELQLADGPEFSRAERSPFVWVRAGAVDASTVHLQSRIEREAALQIGERRWGTLRVVSHREREVLEPLGRALVQVLADGLAGGLVGLAERRRLGPVSGGGRISYG